MRQPLRDRYKREAVPLAITKAAGATPSSKLGASRDRFLRMTFERHDLATAAKSLLLQGVKQDVRADAEGVFASVAGALQRVAVLQHARQVEGRKDDGQTSIDEQAFHLRRRSRGGDLHP